MTNFRSFEFDVPPSPGDAVTLSGGQRYEMAGSEPYTRRDGTETVVVTWLAQCPDCGEPFEFKAGLRIRWPNRRCKACASPGRKVG